MAVREFYDEASGFTLTILSGPEDINAVYYFHVSSYLYWPDIYLLSDIGGEISFTISGPQTAQTGSPISMIDRDSSNYGDLKYIDTNKICRLSCTYIANIDLNGAYGNNLWNWPIEYQIRDGETADEEITPINPHPTPAPKHRLIWDADNDRSFEYGVSKGVLYVKMDARDEAAGTDYYPGVAWNGLTTVDMEPDGFDKTPVESDGFIYDNLYSPEYLVGNIESYGYPDAFSECIGKKNYTSGVYVGQQKHRKFGFCYRTEVTGGYIIHVIYDCTAYPAEESSDTFGETAEAKLYSWKFDTMPVESNERLHLAPFSEITFDSMKIPLDRLLLLENTLYGTDESLPTLPDVDALLNLVDTGVPPSPWTGGVTPVEGVFTANGTYTAETGYAYTPVTVDVPVGDAVKLIEGDITNYIGNDIVRIRNYAFYNYLDLESVEFPECIAIGGSAFYHCNQLSVVTFPVCIYIYGYAFAYCSSLTSVAFPVCTEIGPNAFGACSNLVTVSFPACTAIGIGAFNICSRLEFVSMSLCSTIGRAAFGGCSRLTSVSFPVCYYIDTVAFQSCISLVSVSFPACTYIGDGAFVSCSRLMSISFPSCRTIATSAFSMCGSLTDISFPVCSTISSWAFYRCSSLSTAIFLSSSVVNLGNSNAFQNTPIQNSSYLGYFGSIYVPASLVDAYKSATNWVYYSDRITAYIE